MIWFIILVSIKNEKEIKIILNNIMKTKLRENRILTYIVLLLFLHWLGTDYIIDKAVEKINKQYQYKQK